MIGASTSIYESDDVVRPIMSIRLYGFHTLLVHAGAGRNQQPSQIVAITRGGCIVGCISREI